MTLSKGAIAGIVVACVVVAVAAVVLGWYYGIYQPSQCDDKCAEQEWMPTTTSCDVGSATPTCSNENVGNWLCAQGYYQLFDEDGNSASGPYLLLPTSTKNVWTLALQKWDSFTTAIMDDRYGAPVSVSLPDITVPSISYGGTITSGSIYTMDPDTGSVNLLGDATNATLATSDNNEQTDNCLAGGAARLCVDCNSPGDANKYYPLTFNVSSDNFTGFLTQIWIGRFGGRATNNMKWHLYDSNNNWVSGPYTIEYTDYETLSVTYAGNYKNDTYIVLPYDPTDSEKSALTDTAVELVGISNLRVQNGGLYKSDLSLCVDYYKYQILPSIHQNMLRLYDDPTKDWHFYREDYDVPAPTSDPITLECTA